MRVSKNLKDIIAYNVEKVFIDQVHKCDLQIEKEKERLKKQMEGFKCDLERAENIMLKEIITNLGKQYSDLEYDAYSIKPFSFKEDAKEIIKYLAYNVHYSKAFSVGRVSSKKLRDLMEKRQNFFEAKKVMINDIVLQIECDAKTKEDVQRILDNIKVEE